jgi:hypothetical protein
MVKRCEVWKHEVATMPVSGFAREVRLETKRVRFMVKNDGGKTQTRLHQQNSVINEI